MLPFIANQLPPANNATMIAELRKYHAVSRAWMVKRFTRQILPAGCSRARVRYAEGAARRDRRRGEVERPWWREPGREPVVAEPERDADLDAAWTGAIDTLWSGAVETGAIPVIPVIPVIPAPGSVPQQPAASTAESGTPPDNDTGSAGA